jgi:quercetin dioxygenase-like cupin family protein
MRRCAILLISLIPIAGAAAGGQDASSRYLQSYSNPALRGETLLDNDRLVVQKFVIPPGTWEGQHTHAGNQLWVQMTDGEWTSHADRTKVSRVKAGSVGWLPPAARPEHDEGSINTGSTPIELLWVTLKPHTATPSEIESMKNYRLVYPEIPGELLLDNDQVVVQRFVVQPGAWEGVHAHPGNQLYVHVKGGTWAVRTGGRETVSESKTGSVGWYRAIPLSQQHQSGNAGAAPIDLVWITLKQ